MTDIFTAFGQRLAGRGDHAATGHDLMAGLVAAVRRAGTHPAVLDSRDFWLENAARTTLWVGDPEITGSPCDDDLVSVSSVLSGELTAAVDEAQRCPADPRRRDTACRAGPDDRVHQR